ncbi:MAG TPA: hypothetical protein VI451_18370 [Anaerolineales bacterium]|nr:hypothetical protein [Anaerolineales bacterium]
MVFSACGGGGGVSDGLQMPESPLLKIFERKSGRILYLGLDGNLYTINQAGEDEIPITSDANSDTSSPKYGGYLRFAWAPDSEKIAYVGFNREKVFVKTVKPDGSDPVENFSSMEEIPIYLYWTPDSQYISFLANHIASSNLSLLYAKADGSSAPAIIGTGQPYFWVWEPGTATRFLAHVGTEEESGRLVMISTDTDREREFQLNPAVFQAPSWSPDGNSLMMAISERTSDNFLVVTNLQGVIQNRIAQIGDSAAFGWSPDGKWVSYITSERERGSALGTLTIRNLSDPEKSFSTGSSFVFAYFWAPDSKNLVYFTLELADSGSETQSEPVPAVGLYKLDSKSGEIKNLMFFIPTQQFLEMLQYFDQYQHSATIWSPDSENVVISALAADGKSAVIVVVPASGNLQPRPISEGLMAFWSWK